jgi:hypothetical protein
VRAAIRLTQSGCLEFRVQGAGSSCDLFYVADARRSLLPRSVRQQRRSESDAVALQNDQMTGQARHHRRTEEAGHNSGNFVCEGVVWQPQNQDALGVSWRKPPNFGKPGLGRPGSPQLRQDVVGHPLASAGNALPRSLGTPEVPGDPAIRFSAACERSAERRGSESAWFARALRGAGNRQRRCRAHRHAATGSRSVRKGTINRRCRALSRRRVSRPVW